MAKKKVVLASVHIVRQNFKYAMNTVCATDVRIWCKCQNFSSNVLLFFRDQYIRGDLKNKPNYLITKKRFKLRRRTFIFQVFSMYPPPIHTHFSQRSYHHRKAVANSSAALFLVTPSQVFFKVPSSKDRPASSSFTLQNKKKSAGARSGEYGGCSSRWMLWAANHSWTTAAIWTSALSQWNHHSCWTIWGLFFFSCLRKLPRAFTMYQVFTCLIFNSSSFGS